MAGVEARVRMHVCAHAFAIVHVCGGGTINVTGTGRQAQQVLSTNTTKPCKSAGIF